MVGAKYRDTSGYLLKWLSNPEERGVACVGGGDLDSIWGWSQLACPEGLLTQKQDKKRMLLWIQISHFGSGWAPHTADYFHRLCGWKTVGIQSGQHCSHVGLAEWLC